MKLPKISDGQLKRMAELEDDGCVTAGSAAMLRRFGHLPSAPSKVSGEATGAREQNARVDAATRIPQTLGRKAG